MNLFDNTLRDGGNVVGHGFGRELTVSIIEGLLSAGIRDIEFGNCKGLGAYEKLHATEALSDEEYLDLVQPYLPEGRIGMFQVAPLADRKQIRKAADAGIHFLRVGTNAGDGRDAVQAVEMVKDAGLVCRFSLMKGYLLTPSELAAEAAMLEKAGVDRITIMDSAGTLYPEDAAAYVKALKDAVSIPVGFHGHSNLGLSQANALAAAEAGADEIDCGLLGMARSAGNCCTELALATLQRKGFPVDGDLYTLLHYLDASLIPAMEKEYGYHTAVSPVDLVLGLSGCHSNNLPRIRSIAEEEDVDLFRLIVEVSAVDRKNPSEDLIREKAAQLKQQEPAPAA